MDGYRPGKPQRILTEYTLDFCLHFLGLLVDDIPAVFPLKRFDRDLFVIAGTLNQNIFLKEVGHYADFSIVISFLTGRVILHEHDLRPDLQFQPCFGRISIFREIAAHLGIKRMH